MFRRHQEKPWEENLQSNKELWQQKVNQNKTTRFALSNIELKKHGLPKLMKTWIFEILKANGQADAGDTGAPASDASRDEKPPRPSLPTLSMVSAFQQKKWKFHIPNWEQNWLQGMTGLEKKKGRSSSVEQ